MKAATAGRAGIDVTTSTGHLIRRASQRYSALWASAMPKRLTSPQFTVLALLASGGPLDQQTIGESGGLDKSTCGDVIDRMRRGRLVQAEVDPANRRRKLISLTDEGHARLDEALPFQRRIQDAALTELTDEDRAELNRLLSKMLGLRPIGSDGAPAS